MTATAKRAFLVLATCSFVFLLAGIANAADCDRGKKIAANIFEGADGEARQRNCFRRRIRIKRIRLEDGRRVIRPQVVMSKHVGCIIDEKATGFANAMERLWDRLAGDSWATLGPRQIRYNNVQGGTVVNPTKRTFISYLPLDSDSATISLTKRGGGASTEVAVCSHGPDGDTRLEYSEVISGNTQDGYEWSPPELHSMINRMISIQVQPAGVGKKFGYVLRVSKGEIAELVENEDPASTEPTDDLPPDSGPDSPVLPTQGELLPTSPLSLPGTAPVEQDGTAVALPGVGGGSLPPAGDLAGQGPANVGANSGQCLVTSTRRFPKIQLRCGLSARDETVDLNDDFLADCPLIAGDMVNVEVDDERRELRITGRASGGQWCASRYSPGYYTGPCYSDRTDESTTQVRTYFFQGRKLVDSVIPASCKPARLAAGVYRVISETRGNSEGGGSSLELREAGLRLEGRDRAVIRLRHSEVKGHSTAPRLCLVLHLRWTQRRFESRISVT